MTNNVINDTALAIVGFAFRFPGAEDENAYWQLLRDGGTGLSTFTPDELHRWGVPPHISENPNYVPVAGSLPDIAGFDAQFFGFTPREASLIDPQQRLFMECAWHALEHAGVIPEKTLVGLFAGAGMNTYMLNNLFSQRALMEQIGGFRLMIGNSHDFLPTRTAYKLNLRGPAVNVQTACSTGLVAVHYACQSLLNGECDAALAGAVTLRVPHQVGYMYQDGMILSPAGDCRPFDASAQGTVPSSGVAVVVLKRLQDSIDAQDTIHAVILGTAVNNDGVRRIDYTAPGLNGQTAVIREALAVADVSPETIGYVEAHGTGTPLGDPIEVSALTRAFDIQNGEQQCAIGSVKGNLGHMDTVAGLAGLIKAVLALKNKQIPPTRHFQNPNPEITFAQSPFFVNNTVLDWQKTESPRRAGVSAFGIGGTNAHVILEEAPNIEINAVSGGSYLLAISAKDDHTLCTLASHYRDTLLSGVNLADVCYTANQRRTHIEQRAIIEAQSLEDMIAQLEQVADGQYMPPQSLIAQTYLAGESLPADLSSDGRHTAQCPVYPFTPQKCWIEATVPPLEIVPQIAEAPKLESPARRLALPFSDEVRYQIEMSVMALPHLAEHRLNGQIIVPGAAYIALFLDILNDWQNLSPTQMNKVSLRDVLFIHPLFLGDEETRPVQLIVTPQPDNNDAWQFQFAGHLHDSWHTHMNGSYAPLTATPSTVPAYLDDFIVDSTLIERAEWYTILDDVGYNAGESYQWVERLWRKPDEVFCAFSALPAPIKGGLTIPPGWFDSCLQILGATWAIENQLHGTGSHYIPFRIGAFTLYRSPTSQTFAYAKLTYQDEEKTVGDVFAFDSEGVFLHIAGLEGKRIVHQKFLKQVETITPTNWLYTPQWTQVPIDQVSGDVPVGAWQIIGANGELLQQLQAHNLPIQSADSTQKLTAQNVIFIAPSTLADLVSAIKHTLEYISDNPQHDRHIWWISSHAQAVTSDNIIDETQAALWGMIQSASMEYPEMRFTRVDLDTVEAESLMVALRASINETHLAVRQGQLYSLQLDALSLPEDTAKIHPGATYLITGGFGGLGMATAQWLVDQGAEYLILLGRTLPSAEVRAQINALNVNVRLIQADVTDRSALQAVFDDVGADLRGIFHTAGVLADGLLKHQTAEQFETTWRAKVVGGQLLDELSRACPLDYFVLYSSASALLSSPGQSNYSAANAALDAIAHRRHHNGLTALSINWGPWDGVGMASRQQARDIARVEQRGIHPMSASRALAVMDRALTQSAPQVAIMNVDWRTFFASSVHPDESLSPFFEQVRPKEIVRATRNTDFIQQLRATPQFERRTLLIHALNTQLYELTGIADVSPDQPLFDLGLDSLMAIDLRARLEASLNVALPATLIFDYPTVTAICDYLLHKKLGLELENEVSNNVAVEKTDALESLTLEEVARLLEDELGDS